MDLQTRKYAFILELIKIDRPAIMDKLEEIIHGERDNLFNEQVAE